MVMQLKTVQVENMIVITIIMLICVLYTNNQVCQTKKCESQSCTKLCKMHNEIKEIGPTWTIRQLPSRSYGTFLQKTRMN